MELQGRDLSLQSPQMRGDDVALLHRELLRLGFTDLSEQEINAKRFGARTRRAVELFQQQNGLPADGVVGSRTATALNAAVAALLIVKGQIRRADGRPLAQARVRAFDVDLRYEQPLSEAATELAGLVTAIAGLIVVLSQSGLIGSRGKEETKPVTVESKSPVAEAPKKVAAPPKPTVAATAQPKAVPPSQPEAVPPQQSVAIAPDKPVPKARETPQEPTARLETPRPTPPSVTPTPTTDGWTIIGYYEQGKFSDLQVMVRGDSPAIGRSYEAVEDFRLIQKRPERGQAVITLGMVHRGDSVEVLAIDIERGTRKVPVYAKLRAVLHPIRKACETPQEQTTDGWAIIGFYEQGRFSDLTLMLRGERPVPGQRYEALEDFRLVLKRRPERGEKVITLGKVHRGDSVEVLEVDIERSPRKVPVYVKLRAVLHPIEKASR